MICLEIVEIVLVTAGLMGIGYIIGEMFK